MKPILLILNLLLFVSLTEVHFSLSLKVRKTKKKIIRLGFADTYEKLPKLKFEAITEDEFNKYSSDEFITNISEQRLVFSA